MRKPEPSVFAVPITLMVALELEALSIIIEYFQENLVRKFIDCYVR
jgi:hypothetical protein